MLRKSSKYPRQRVFCVSHTQKLKYTETSKFGHSYKVGIIIIHTFGEVSVKLKSSCNIRHQQLVEASGERERERERERGTGDEGQSFPPILIVGTTVQ